MVIERAEAAKVKGYNRTECHVAPQPGLTAHSQIWQGIAHDNRHPDALKLQIDPRITHLAVTAYGNDYVAVNGRILRRSFLLLPDRIDELWGPNGYTTLSHEDIAPLAALSCDVLLLGTGDKQHFPQPALLRPLIEAGRSIEVMNTQAACRTYNILVAEGRVVAAALIIEPPLAS